MIGAPLQNGRSLVAFLSGSPQGLDAMVDVLRDPKQLSSLQGDLALLAGGTVTSYRAGGTYTVGSLPFWLWPQWWLGDRPIPLLALLLVACVAGAYALNRMLHRRANNRTGSAKRTIES